MHADIECTDGLDGESTHIIVDPAEQQVTHLVVRQRQFSHTEHLVSIDWVEQVAPERIRLSCTRDQLATVEPLLRIDYVRVKHPDYHGPLPQAGWLQTSAKIEEWLPVEYECVPEGEERESANP
jgi:hypothetical protein